MAAVNQRRPTHDNARADHLERAAVAAFTFARRRLFTPTRFPWGQLYCSCIAPCRVAKIFACQACYSRVSLRWCALQPSPWPFVNTHPSIECNNK